MLVQLLNIEGKIKTNQSLKIEQQLIKKFQIMRREDVSND